jgi:PAS domain S-box-containing protein
VVDTEELRFRLAAIVESSDDAIISKRLEGTITSWNRSAERIFGYSAEEAVGRPITILIPAERLDEEVQIMARLRRGERIDHYETVRATKDGRLIDISLTISPIKDGAGKIIGASKIARDITDRKRTEKALHESREWLRVSLSSIGDAVIATDARGCLAFMNPVAETLTGWPHEEALGAALPRVFNIINEETRLPVENPVTRVLADGVIVGLANHTVLISKGGRELPIDDSGAPIRDDKGAILGAILVFRDVTERRQIERDRAELLAREREARERAERANRLKDEFLATISHELRTPLTSILGWARMLRNGTLDEQRTAQALETIERNAKSQAQLIQDLLDVSRIVTGKLRLTLAPLYPAVVIAAAIDAVRPIAEVKGVRLRTVLEQSAGPVYGDAERLQQVIWNLLSNAIKFTDRSGTVTISLEVNGAFIEIKVTDTGKGIKPEFLPYVFDRFTQADSSISRSHGGLGMGLAIARSIVDLHGGVIEARSAGMAAGSTFTVRLPITDRETLAAAAPSSRPSSGEVAAPKPTELKGLRVLVVDDDVDTCDMLKTLLEDCGAEVLTVTSAAQALSAMGSFRPELLIADIGIPDENGYDLIRKVRAREASSFGKIPAIALTAFARVEDRMKALSAGYQMHVPKPIEPDELIAIVVSLAGLLREIG